MQRSLPRLDLLLYAHDGRGLGHVSRSAAIGMALRRLYPELKVALLTGGRQTGELIGPAPLDWLKLPAYATCVREGKSQGIDGPTGYSDQQLGRLRAQQIRQIVELYRPQLILADHLPQGKHKELVPALLATRPQQTKWLLGMRGVMGGVAQAASAEARTIFSNHYKGLLWYGDSRILGTSSRDQLSERFGIEVVESGYVSRLSEISRIGKRPAAGADGPACVLSVPWGDEETPAFLKALGAALSRLGPGFGRCRLFLGQGGEEMAEIFRRLDHCSVEPFSAHYVQALAQSRCAIIFGGYNSLVDVLTVNIPALVVLRRLQDREQQLHLEALISALPGRLRAVEERDCSEAVLHEQLTALLHADPAGPAGNIAFDGAERAAHFLVSNL